MRRKLLYGLLFVLIFLLLSGAVMFLWNALLPQVILVTTINYWQALGLMVLSRILFGRFNLGGAMGGHRGDGPPGFLKSKLMSMNETDRAAFKQEWQKRCEERDSG